MILIIKAKIQKSLNVSQNFLKTHSLTTMKTATKCRKITKISHTCLMQHSKKTQQLGNKKKKHSLRGQSIKQLLRSTLTQK